jgi:hypothetical protein
LLNLNSTKEQFTKETIYKTQTQTKPTIPPIQAFKLMNGATPNNCKQNSP